MQYIPSTAEERAAMLGVIGKPDLPSLFDSVPASVKRTGGLALPPGRTEFDVYGEMEALSETNRHYKTIFRGAGAYRHYIPAVVGHLASQSSFLTAYTPYQAEISQGVLQTIFEYQSMICALTDMDAANASVYDGATAAAEAISMCRERGRDTALVSALVHPKRMDVIRTYAKGLGITVVEIPGADGQTDASALQALLRTHKAACVYIEQPNYYGVIEDAEGIGRLVKEAAGAARYIMGCYPIALALLQSPGACGADIAVGEGQPLGLPLAYGGPYLGYMAARSDMMRKLPGRIVGETTDAAGKRGFVLTLQAREQHIRREKASSNICSNEAHCALRASIYMSAMGPEGLREVAEQCYAKAHYMANRLADIQFTLPYAAPFFNEFVTEAPTDTRRIETTLSKAGILSGLPLDGGRMLWCATEVNTKTEIDRMIAVLEAMTA